MTTTSAPTTHSQSWRAPSLLLILSLPVFAAFLVVAATSFPEPYAADMNAAQVDEMGLRWPLVGLLWTLPIWLGAAGLLMAARRSPATGSKARVVQGLAIFSAAAITAYLALWLSLTNTDAAQVGDAWAHQAGIIASVTGGWSAIVATGLLALQLRTAGILGRAGVVFAVICGLYLLVEVLTWLPVMSGSVELSRGGGVPPFLIAIIWCGFGIVLRRRGVTSGS